MAENPQELQGEDWFSKLANPQGKSLDTGTAEGLGAPQQDQNVAPQQQ